ncbi:MAG: aminotransferase class I/II-fold pyridoxal phosphate-dependent enzyme [Acholeplasmatales bacterium]|nr:aminotransferase class I/II-fold pyridoxal phosphate-dependent enzyme [Acholeplasmatales bacterium]
MTLLAKRSVIKEDKSNIITLGAIAKEMKKKDSSITNATIGMLYDEEGKLFTFKSVDLALSSLTPDEKYAYASTPGGANYHEALKRWIFREHYDSFMAESNVRVMATPGGSGAISNTFTNYLNPSDKVLVPNYMWGNYKQFAYENHADFETYNLFDNDGNFNLADVKDKMLKLKNEQGRVLLVVNDPCHNPTGYTMKDSEWKELINIINELSSDNTPIILLHDMAYIDYDYRGFDATRKNICLYKNLNDSVLVILAFSGSKTLALYGIRVGAQIAISKRLEYVEEFSKACQFSSRAKWSNTSNLGMNLIAKVILEPELRAKFEAELEDSRRTLVARANAFLTESKNVGLKTIPFVCGFFITIPCDNPNKVYEILVSKKVHIIPMGNMVRVTIAAISLEECKKLPKMIKEAIEEAKK